MTIARNNRPTGVRIYRIMPQATLSTGQTLSALRYKTTNKITVKHGNTIHQRIFCQHTTNNELI